MKNELSYQKLLETAKKIGVPTKKVLDIVYFLINSPIKNEDLIRKVGIAKNPLNQIKKHLARYLEPTSKLTVVKNEFKSKFQKIFPKSYKLEESLFSFLKANQSYQELFSFVNLTKKYRPLPLREFDQFYTTEEMVVQRVLLMDFFADIKGKRILFLGDDDFISLPVAFLKKKQ